MMAKGGAFEREMCKRFSWWWADREDVFWRTSNSGGRAGARARTKKRTAGQYGDMAATDPIGAPLIDLLTFEFKRGYTARCPGQLVDRTDTCAVHLWETFFMQAITAHERDGSAGWAIIQRRDKAREMIWLPKHILDGLRGAGAFAAVPRPYARLSLDVRSKNGPVMVDTTGITLEAFFENVTPDHVRKLLETA